MFFSQSPGVPDLLRHPALTANGLETLLSGPVQRRWWFWLLAVTLAALGGCAFIEASFCPQPFPTRLDFDAFY